MQYDYISSDQQLQSFCDRETGDSPVYFDTEFVSEDTYLPELCLIQVAVDDQLAIIDPLALTSIKPFWELIAKNGRQTVVHAGREEFRFCWRAVQQRPSDLFDVQLAAGLIGLEYPASYGKLISKLLGVTLPKGEARTNWRQRPLTERQLEYALQDVVHLPALQDALQKELERLGRPSWLQDEMEAWQQELVESETRERWRRVSGISGLSARSLVIVRELWRWRDQEAKQSNRPPRRVLRDDLIVELARRTRADMRQIKAIRGIEHSGAKRHLKAISECVQAAISLPRERWPSVNRPSIPQQVNVLGQFLATALTGLCRSQQLAPNLVGTAQDVRDLVAYRLGFQDDRDGPPALARGWRSQVVGSTLQDLLDGNLAIRIRDPLSEEPLAFEPVRTGDED